MSLSPSTSPRRAAVHPAMVRDAKTGEWKLKSNYDSSPTKSLLTPGRGAELRDVARSHPPALGPDPQHKLMASVQVAARHEAIMKQSTLAVSPRGIPNATAPGASHSPPSHGRRRFVAPTAAASSSPPQNSESVSTPLGSEHVVGSVSPMRRRSSGTSNTAVDAVDPVTVNRSIASFEDKLLRLDLRSADETSGADTRPDTPVDDKAAAAAALGFAVAAQHQQQQRGRLASSSHGMPATNSGLRRGLAPGANNNNSNGHTLTASPSDLAASTLTAAPSGVTASMLNIFSSFAGSNASFAGMLPGWYQQQQQLQKPDPAAGITFYLATNDPNGPPPRPWENLTASRAQNPIFGILSGVSPSQLRRLFLRILPEFPKARARGLTPRAVARLLGLAAPHVDLSEHLVLRCMSYFDVVQLVDEDLVLQAAASASSKNNSSNSGDGPAAGIGQTASLSFDQQFPQNHALSALTRVVTLPQLLIRFAADSSPRHTDVAVVAVFACFASMPPSSLRSNSAIYITTIQSKAIRTFCAEKFVGDNSVARNHWLAIADALDEASTQRDLQELIADVVHVPPPLQRTELEKRIFGDRLANGAPLPPPALITLDQWRYVCYASERLLPLCQTLRQSVENPEDDAVRKFVAVSD